MQITGKEFPSTNSNHFHRYLQYSVSILSSYKGQEPFHLFLKKYFSANRKHGSKDRKLITALCYNYFRLGFGVSTPSSQDENFLLAVFLCEKSSSLFLDFFKPELNASISLPLIDKLKIVNKEFNEEKIFPFSDELSNEINFRQFNLSFLIQPKLFIRIRPGFREIVINKIKHPGFSFEQLNENCIAFSNNEKVSNTIEIDKEAVVQDYNSQITLDFLKPIIENEKVAISIWDCCAGSGGKSILAFDLFRNINITVSDKRKSILENLKVRFEEAGIKNYNPAPADLEKSFHEIDQSFDIIIADVPCSGSGTWARTPEQLHFFKKDEIKKYALLQRKIVENALPHLKNNGHLLYVTCSVFKKENEENVILFQEKYKLNLLKLEYLKGYEMQADTMFVALFIKVECSIALEA
ncbi:Fmu (Sun) domain-containing protein [Ginsengibacter hankyongi]|uniref:Fmu (Sun) domain-containing protein n=1 Tax=Ginsengibacter hankyongi TaxID=2607284 RepID=A0A5J5II64_9BACT|nr:methyltransferase domain-containing protein [Ginsengibacter hankyongi]KAA9039268.1 Fmu (Sun) domain-containing protein [Ginsengibacter hankyongi]